MHSQQVSLWQQGVLLDEQQGHATHHHALCVCPSSSNLYLCFWIRYKKKLASNQTSASTLPNLSWRIRTAPVPPSSVKNSREMVGNGGSREGTPVAKYRLSSKTCCGMVELWANNLKERCCFVATLMSHSLPMLLTAGLTFLDRSRCALVHGLEMVYQQCIRMPQCFDAARSEVVPQSWSDIILRDCTAAEQSLLLV